MNIIGEDKLLSKIIERQSTKMKDGGKIIAATFRGQHGGAKQGSSSARKPTICWRCDRFHSITACTRQDSAKRGWMRSTQKKRDQKVHENYAKQKWNFKYLSNTAGVTKHMDGILVNYHQKDVKWEKGREIGRPRISACQDKKFDTNSPVDAQSYSRNNAALSSATIKSKSTQGNMRFGNFWAHEKVLGPRSNQCKVVVRQGGEKVVIKCTQSRSGPPESDANKIRSKTRKNLEEKNNSNNILQPLHIWVSSVNVHALVLLDWGAALEYLVYIPEVRDFAAKILMEMKFGEER